MRKIFIRTLGCQMNVRDSEVIAGLLPATSYELTTNPDEADVVIFNTCSVRQHAEDKVWSEIGRFKRAKQLMSSGARKLIIGVVGCMAQNYKEAIFERAPNVDFVVGPTDIYKIPEIIEKLGVGRTEYGVKPLLERKIWETDSKTRPEEIYHTGFYEDKEHAFVVISEGCSNYCSYCVVPYVRGEIRHRNHKDIITEIEEAVAKGTTKFTLLGQNVNAYQSTSYGLRSPDYRHSDTNDFIALLETVNRIKGIKEFSFITSHPRDTSTELFEALAGLDRLKKYLHLPVQSGSDRILKLMNRGYSRKFYLDLADNYRKIVKDGALTTDIIVGFPSETDNDFNDTFDLVKKIEFEAGFIFKYSPRPNTSALNLADDVPKPEKERRHKLILELQKEISKKKK